MRRFTEFFAIGFLVSFLAVGCGGSTTTPSTPNDEGRSESDESKAPRAADGEGSGELPPPKAPSEDGDW